MKAIIIILLFAVLLSLGSGLLFLVKDGSNSGRVVKALTWRVGLSLGLFLVILFCLWQGSFS